MARPGPIDFLGIPDPAARSLESARYVVLPVPYETSVTFLKGTRFGPQALLMASHQLELRDEETDDWPWKAGIHTLPPYAPDVAPPEFMKGLADAAEVHMRAGRFVLTIGGEHSLSEGPVAAAARVHKDLSVLHVDAHADLREELDGDPYSHACAARRWLPHVKRIVQCGIRNVGTPERKVVNRGPVRTFLAHETRPFAKFIPRIVKALTRNVYVSIDLDGLDPSVMPGVGTPVPGGLLWYDVLDLLRATVRARNVVSADIVELMPIAGEAVSEFTAARLAHKLIAYTWRKRKK